jgi:hypothetical protein
MESGWARLESLPEDDHGVGYGVLQWAVYLVWALYVDDRHEIKGV